MRRVRQIIALTLISLILLASVSTNAQEASDERAIKEAVERLFRSLEKDDIDEIMSHWSRSSPQFDYFKRITQEGANHSKNTQFSNVTFSRWKKAAGRVELYVGFDIKDSNELLNRTVQRRVVWVAQFVNENGNWKWFRMENVGQEVGMRLSLAKTKEERMQILERERDILTASTIGFFLSESMERFYQRNFSDAIRLTDIGLEVATAMDNKGEIARCYGHLGLLSLLNYDHQEAIRHFERAHSLFLESGDPIGQTQTLNNMAEAHRKLGQYPEALRRLTLALKTAREARDPFGEALALNIKGVVHRTRGEYPDALKDYEASLEISRKIYDSHGQAKTLTNIGEAYWLIGDYNEALERLEAGRDLAYEINDKEIELMAKHNIALVHLSTGRFLEALTQLDKLVTHAEEVGELDYREFRAQALSNLGLVYSSMGNYSEGLRKCEQSLEIAREIDNGFIEAGALTNKAKIYAMTERYDEAMQMCEEALKIVKGRSEKQAEAMILQSMGIISWLKEEKDRPFEYLESALELARKMGYKSAEVWALMGLGYVYNSEERYKEAVENLQQALRLSESIGDSAAAARCYQELGYAYRGQKRWEAAIKSYETAIDRIERIRSQTIEPLLQAGFFAQYIAFSSPYFGLAHSLLEQRADVSGAFAVSEKARARSLIEIIKAGGVGLMEGLSAQDKHREQVLASKIIKIEAEINAALSAHGPSGRVDGLKRQRDDLHMAYDRLQRDLFVARRELQVRNVRLDPVTLTRLNREFFSVSPDACLLYYLVDDDKVIVLAITRGRQNRGQAQTTYYSLKTEQGEDLTRKELNSRIEELRWRCKKPFGLYKSYAQSLYKILIASAEKEIAGKSHLVIIPEGPLNTLPFQVLTDGQGKHLIERYNISYAPSAAALLEMMKLADVKKRSAIRSRPIFAMGRRTFPDHAEHRKGDLHWAEDQANSIASLFKAKAFTDSDATEAKALAEMTKARYVHFATHGNLNEAAPMYSAILLGKGKDDDGMLYARELMDMKLRAELVTLSACDTALGRQVSGEGMLGLTWALFAAGTPSSVVTQWSVSDDSMNKLMVEFYRQLRDSEASGKKAGKAEALRRAQLLLMKDEKYKHPYHWAPVVLSGDWR